MFLKLQPCEQTTAALRRNIKLNPRYFSSHKIIQKIGTVAYKLLLPKMSANTSGVSCFIAKII